MDQLNRYLADFDRSPTVQALLVLMLVFMRYVVGEAFARRAEARRRQSDLRKAKDSGA